MSQISQLGKGGSVVVIQFKYLSLTLMFLMSQTGCAEILGGYVTSRANEDVGSEVKNLGYLYSPKQVECDIRILSSKKPNNPHVVIGKVKSHVRRNMIITNDETPKQDLENEIRKQGCALGGDIIIIDKIVDKTSGSSGHLEAWSTVIKFK
jgi:hypothetical protein